MAGAPAGYSGTPLPQKLGLRDGQRVLFLDLPETLADLATARMFAAAERGRWSDLRAQGGWDLIHGFTTQRAVLEDHAAVLREALRPDGMVWLCWPKKASRVETDITEGLIRRVLLPTGLVDVKVAAIDQVWSGLKLMVRRELR